jgi:hypothetical protein
MQAVSYVKSDENSDELREQGNVIYRSNIKSLASTYFNMVNSF